MRIETLAVHAGRVDNLAVGPVSDPIFLSTTYERQPDGNYPQGYLYSRLDNPNRHALESCLAALEGGVAAAAFSSGSAATMAVFQALAPGDHVLAPNDVYYGTANLLRDTFVRWGLECTFVDMTSPPEVKKSLRPNTKLVWLETPSNPLLKITDLRQMAELAHAAGALCACDNTWTTPVIQRPFELGVDLVVHATTKYLTGHSDVVGGAVIARSDDSFFRTVRQLQTSGGAVPSPFDCWLTLRGIRTLPYRVRAQSESAARIADFLCKQARVKAVHYPGLKQHPGHQIAARQMSLFGGMLSFQVEGGREAAMGVAAKVKTFTRATSLGGVESLIEHRASVEGPNTKTPLDLLRISIGLEHWEDLKEDLAQALS